MKYKGANIFKLARTVILLLFLAIGCYMIYRLAFPHATVPNKDGFYGNSTQEKGPSASPSDVEDRTYPSPAIVVVDPGHGGRDEGANVKGLREKDINLDIGKKLGDMLEDSGVKVIYTRTEDVKLTLADRYTLANEQHADLFVSVHNNTLPNVSSYSGIETLYCPSGKKQDQTMDGERFATIVQDTLVDQLEADDHGIISRPDLAVLNKTNMPAVIAEIGYMTNASDREKLKTQEYREKAAQALHDAVLKALEEMGAEKDDAGVWMFQGNR